MAVMVSSEGDQIGADRMGCNGVDRIGRDWTAMDGCGGD